MTEPVNEPVLTYAPASPERASLRAEIARQKSTLTCLRSRIGDRQLASSTVESVRAPHRHELEIARAEFVGRSEVQSAIDAALAAQSSWAALDLPSRAAIFRRAAELAAGPFRQRLNAATLLGQSKTPHQAEIDSACELIDFLRFNAYFAERLAEEKLISTPFEQNRFDFRPLEGFVYAVTPFNFTAIAANLPTAPALLGNVVVWKPSPYALLSAHYVFELLREAGLPPGVLNLVIGDAREVSDEVLSHTDFAGLNFTGSSAVFEQLFQRVASRLGHYKNYPRLVGETGGKDFIVAHSSADLDALAVAILRGGFEYQGQKCSAASRVYVPRSLAAALEARLLELVGTIRVGDPENFENFMGAVIGRAAYDRITGAIERAKSDPQCRIVFGGEADDRDGFFINPTLIEVKASPHFLLSEELFGPVVAMLVYDDDRYDEVLRACDADSRYALTGSIFAEDQAAIDLASRTLRFAAGNFYINDKPTGAVVGQQPFGGARRSGTNDKAGCIFHLLRWISPRVTKHNLRPPKNYRYPFLEPDDPNPKGTP
ncbi:MAG TPA: L-glutamate gamma-semialdehyde dehydrogenase [Polyangiaceae bacterium]|nr:L-glutamate gamma-semialdehyde dehydrogenase [Polyangiaceae bacterium]